MFRKTLPSTSYPVFLDVVITPRVVCVTSYVEVFWDSKNPRPPIESTDTQRKTGDLMSLRLDGPIIKGELPPLCSGIYYRRLPNMRYWTSAFPGEELDPKFKDRWFKSRSYSLIDLDDPSISPKEKADVAVWSVGVDYDGILHPFANVLALSTITHSHPLRTMRMFGSPAIFFIYQPFFDTPFTECSMTLKTNLGLGYRCNLGNWESIDETEGFNYLPHMTAGLPSLHVESGGGSIQSGATSSVTLSLTTGTGEPISRSTTIYLESTGGYLPKTRLDMIDGSVTFNVVALGLSSGEKFKVKAGFLNYSGCAEVNFVVGG